jgi:ribosomal protein S9
MTAIATPFRWQAVGRRKTSVRRVYLTQAPGSGHQRSAPWAIFPAPFIGPAHPAPLRPRIRSAPLMSALTSTGRAGRSSGAVRLAVRARASIGRYAAPDQAAPPGLLTRDPRARRGKKPGRPAHGSASVLEALEQDIIHAAGFRLGVPSGSSGRRRRRRTT